MAKVAVVVLTYNGKKLHEKFLPSIIAEKEQFPDFELIVVDNASTDGTGEYVNENFPEARVIRLDVNKGFTNGYVQGLKQVDAEYYVLLSADFEVTPGWIKPCIDIMDNDPQVGACQPKIKYYKQKTQFEYAGGAGGWIDKYGYPFCRGRIFYTVEEDTGQYDETQEIFWASGGCMFVRASLYEELGGFDNDFYAHMEEIDLCWRMKNSGYKIMACPDSIVYHVGGSVISYGSPEKIYHNFRNGLILLVKNLPPDRFLRVMLIRFMLDYIAETKALLSLNFGEFWAIIRAQWAFYSQLGKWMKKRRELKKYITNPNNTAIYQRSIVWQYFIKGKKRFSDLDI